MARYGRKRGVRHATFDALTRETDGVGTRMIQPRALSTCCGVAWFAIASVSAGVSADEKPRSFEVGITALYSNRSVDAAILIDKDGPLSALATSDSLGLGNARDPQAAIDFRWKRLNFALSYIPTTFNGEGFAQETIEVGDIGISFDTPVTTTVDVTLSLLVVQYSVIQKPDENLGFGLGLGRTSVDIELIPDIGQGINANGNTPFGFLAVSYGRVFNRRWLFDVAYHTTGTLDMGGFEMDYTDMNVGGGFRILPHRVKLDALVGYRGIKFDFDYDIDGGETRLNIKLAGPYAGLRVSF